MFKKLEKGDTIGVIAPSSLVNEDDSEAINNSVSLMESAGFHIEFGKNVFKNTLGYGATPQEKAEDINEMFKNKDIKAIICLSGGFNSNSTFEYLDYDIIKHNPKPICGFSDSTALLNNIYTKTGIITFHGPTFKSLTTWKTDYGYKELIKRLVYGSIELGQPEDKYISICEGMAEGKLIGGNLSLTSEMSAGCYATDFKDKILFIEELSLESPPELVFNHLYYLKQNGVFDKIKGIWIGNYDGNIALEKIVLDVLQKKYNFPIIKSNNFGHTEKKTVIPIGAMAKIDTSKKYKITLTDNIIN